MSTNGALLAVSDLHKHFPIKQGLGSGERVARSRVLVAAGSPVASYGCWRKRPALHLA